MHIVPRYIRPSNLGYETTQSDHFEVRKSIKTIDLDEDFISYKISMSVPPNITKYIFNV